MESKEQSQAINHINGAAMVLAGPGSGKTFVITHRLKHLIYDEKINPSNILVITFTKAAAKEMRERFIKLCESFNLNNIETPIFGTFHSIFFSILREKFGYDMNSLINKSEMKKLLIDVLEKHKNIKLTEQMIDGIYKDILNYKLSKEKCEDYKPIFLSKNIFYKIVNEYNEYLFNSRKLDFHDMIEVCFTMLNNNKKILDFYQEKFKYILIDEFQDINLKQYNIIKLLSKNKNIFVVGDDDQSIYSFRGSDPKIMKKFLKDYKNCKVINLDRNYRSSQSIVRFSKNIIDVNKQRFKKNLVANDKRNGNINIKLFNDSIDENEYIINTIKKINMYGYNLSDIAILYRTNLLSSSICQDLKKHSINFLIKDIENSPFEFFAISDILSYIRLSINFDIKNFINIMNKPYRYIRRDILTLDMSIDNIISYYDDRNFIKNNILKLKNDIYKLKTMNPTLAIKYIRQFIGYDKYLIEYCKNKNIDFKDCIDKIDDLEDLSVRFRTSKEFIKFIDEYEEIIKNEKNDKTNNEDCIKLMTFHSSKGLEFKYVIIIDANDGLIPHKKSIASKDIETERRLFYVACTRAKERLDIIFTINRNGKSYKPSRFIIEGLKGVKNER